MKLKELLAAGISALKNSGIEEAEIDAWYLFEEASGLGRAEYFLCFEDEADEKLGRSFLELINRRKERVPLAYILGYREFMGFRFSVNENVLIPEPETELLVEKVIECSEGKRILDLCTGSGCIAISVAALGKPRSVTASDISAEALNVAKENFLRLGKGETADISFVQSDLFENMDGRFDIIVSNPPYIESGVIEELEPEVKKFIPRLALDGAADGLRFYREISGKAAKYLEENGKIFYEIGYNQGRAVVDILAENGFVDIEIIQDFAGLDRIVAGKLNKRA